MRNRWMLVPLIAACLGAAYASAQSGLTTEATVTAFLAAIEKGDLKTAGSYVLDSKVDSQFDPVGKMLKEQALHLEVSDFKESIQGDDCTVTFNVAATAGGRKQDLSGQTLNLRRVNGAWKIRSGVWPTPEEPDKGRQVESLVTILAHPESMRIAQGSAVSTACLSNLKQLSTAVLMFMQDNNDKYLLSSSKLQTKLAPYVKNNELFHCPDKAHPDAYSFNDRLSGKKGSSLASPATTVVLYEGVGEKLTYRHNGRAAVAFADGHVKLIKPEEAKSLVWKP